MSLVGIMLADRRAPVRPRGSISWPASMTPGPIDTARRSLESAAAEKKIQDVEHRIVSSETSSRRGPIPAVPRRRASVVIPPSCERARSTFGPICSRNSPQPDANVADTAWLGECEGQQPTQKSRRRLVGCLPLLRSPSTGSRSLSGEPRPTRVAAPRPSQPTVSPRP